MNASQRNRSQQKKPEFKTDFWEKLLEALDGKLPIGTYNLLFDAAQVQGTLEGSELTISINPGFAMNMINKADVTQQFKTVAGELNGAPVTLRLEEAKQSSSPAPDKLDELGKYGIVTFK